MKLYHGSLDNILGENLEPHYAFKTYNYKKAVYFTKVYEMALLFSINPIRVYIRNANIEDTANAFSSFFNFDVEKNKVVLKEYYEGMLEEVYNNSSYIYVLDMPKKDDCENNYEYTFYESIKFNKKIYIPNVLDELLQLEKQNKIEIRRFEKMTYLERSDLYESISCRANSCESQAEYNFFKEKFAGINIIQKELFYRQKVDK